MTDDDGDTSGGGTSPTDDERVDALFSLPPEEFTAARDALVKTLKKEGRREVAQEVAGLRRPTLAAWAVNQAVRSEPDAYASLREAGDRMRQALRRAMSGVGQADVGGATQERRRRVDAMTSAATRHLEAAGHNPDAHREDVAATFDAASAHEESGAQVARGRLSRTLERPSEFGELSPLAVVEEAPESVEGTVEPDEDAERVEAIAAARGRMEEARAAADLARQQAHDAAQQARSAEADGEEAHERMERARREHEQARQRADAARRAAERARDQAETAEATAQRRAAELADLRGH